MSIENGNVGQGQIPPAERTIKLNENLASTLSASETPLAEGVRSLVGLIESKRGKKKSSPVFVMIAGRSGSGKTRIAAEIRKKYGDDASTISMDDYFKGGRFLDDSKSQGMNVNRDHPSYMDFGLLRKHLEELGQNKTIEKPVFNYEKRERDGSEIIPPNKVIVVEGLFALREEMLGFGDIKAFVDVSLHGSMIRRILRDVVRSHINQADIFSYYLEFAEPMYRKYIEETKKNADLIILNEYEPLIEAQKFSSLEAQVKFKEPNVREKLWELGAEMLGRVRQDDLYVVPKDRKTAGSDEHIRIREEGGRFIFTYKGPGKHDEMRMRPKIELEIDKKICDAILDRYADKGIMVVKYREIYLYHGLIINLDSVIRNSGKETEVLGDFVEIVCNDEAQGEAKIKGACESLGIPYDTRITDSYLEY